MIVGVPRETFPGERRVAVVPSSIPTLGKGGLEVIVEAGAGAQAFDPRLGACERKSGGAQADSSGPRLSATFLSQVLLFSQRTRCNRPRFVSCLLHRASSFL